MFLMKILAHRVPIPINVTFVTFVFHEKTCIQNKQLCGADLVSLTYFFENDTGNGFWANIYRPDSFSMLAQTDRRMTLWILKRQCLYSESSNVNWQQIWRFNAMRLNLFWFCEIPVICEQTTNNSCVQSQDPTRLTIY